MVCDVYRFQNNRKLLKVNNFVVSDQDSFQESGDQSSKCKCTFVFTFRFSFAKKNVKETVIFQRNSQSAPNKVRQMKLRQLKLPKKLISAKMKKFEGKK